MPKNILFQNTQLVLSEKSCEKLQDPGSVPSLWLWTQRPWKKIWEKKHCLPLRFEKAWKKQNGLKIEISICALRFSFSCSRHIFWRKITTSSCVYALLSKKTEKIDGILWALETKIANADPNFWWIPWKIAMNILWKSFREINLSVYFLHYCQSLKKRLK